VIESSGELFETKDVVCERLQWQISENGVPPVQEQETRVALKHLLDTDREATVDLSTAAAMLGTGVSTALVRARLRRGSLAGVRLASGEWRVLAADLTRVLADFDACPTCHAPATHLVIIKYHFHERLQFTLCEQHAKAAAATYRLKGGVIEVGLWPLVSEAWMKAR
jgi:hypothetical protein